MSNSREAATELLRTISGGKWLPERPPFDPWAAARHLGVEVKEVPEPSWWGALDNREGFKIAWLDAGLSNRNKRFTLIHELGHHLLHANGLYRCALFNNNELEREANDFAATFLAPLYIVEPLASHSSRSAVQMVDVFDVPGSILALQLRKLL